MFEYVTLICGGYEFIGFQEVEVRRSMQDAAISFRLEATWPRYSPQAKAIRDGDEVEIYTQALSGDQQPKPGGGDLLCIGAVDDYEADLGEGSHKRIVLNGRSHARDVVDCPPVRHPTLRSENTDLLGHARNLLGEFDVAWATDQALRVIPKVQAEPGEKGFAIIERHARMEGLLLAGQADGSIVITRAGSKRHAGALVEGAPPVNRWSVKISPGSLRSPVVVKGQRATGTGDANLRQQDSYSTPNAPKRHRPAHVVLEGDRPGNQLRTRGAWHHLRAMGFKNIAAPRVSTWRDENGALWTPGLLMAIRIPSEDIDMDMLLAEAMFKQGRGRDAGTRAELTCTDPRDLGGQTPMGTQDQVTDPGDSIGRYDQGAIAAGAAF
jgi:prophage tail gpP-like protein